MHRPHRRCDAQLVMPMFGMFQVCDTIRFQYCPSMRLAQQCTFTRNTQFDAALALYFEVY